MREAIGATWIFGIVIVFIVVFTGYLAFSVNYAKAFAMKDSIIDIIEKHNGPGGITGEDHTSESAPGLVLNEVNEKMQVINYYAKGNCKTVADAMRKTMTDAAAADKLYKYVMGVTNSKAYTMMNKHDSYFAKRKYNYCIIRQDQDALDDHSIGFSNYYVATFFSININMINIIKVDFNFFVTGQTKNIAYPIDGFFKRNTEEYE